MSRAPPVVVKSIRSPPALLVRLTRIAIEAPVKLALTVVGLMGSLYVSVILSFCSARPTVAPPLEVCTSVPVGVVSLSRILFVRTVEVVSLPAASRTSARRS